ncbi:hypothetical protein A2U01_0033732 [Trifolium medium]|uniref:Uncharacterized protein n=1 Tax=Trifolium medium TaxID=97028 RepID=A0A392PLW6_9FABA|nr:hypothetical protein [Trifolium medium]
MNEAVRTIKVFGKSTNTCYKVEVHEKDLRTTKLNSEWMEERFEEELTEPRGQSYEEADEETKLYTPDEVLIQEMDELDCRLNIMKEYSVQTLKACKEQGQEWVERLTIEINSRGPEAKDSQIEKERLWHSKIFALGGSIIRFRSTMELARKQDNTQWLMDKITRTMDT